MIPNLSVMMSVIGVIVMLCWVTEIWEVVLTMSKCCGWLAVLLLTLMVLHRSAISVNYILLLMTSLTSAHAVYWNISRFSTLKGSYVAYFNCCLPSQVFWGYLQLGCILTDTSTRLGVSVICKHEFACIAVAALHINTTMSMICTRMSCFCMGPVIRQPIRVRIVVLFIQHIVKLLRFFDIISYVHTVSNIPT